MRVFGIFEGGGVRGYAHIGALRALERRGIQFEAVAGTSIGAIVACLVAAGYTADELLTIDDGEPRGIASVTETEVFAGKDLLTVHRLRADLNRLKWFKRVCNLLRLPSPLDFRRPIAVAFAAWISLPILWLLFPIVYLRYRRATSQLWRNFGLAHTSAARTWLERVLREKLGLVGSARELRFSDLKTPLRVIVSDVASGKMHVIGGDADDPLVESVMASASFPLFFIPETSRGRSLVDGGILSNLPAWVFDQQRAAAPACIPTIALRLVGKEESAGATLVQTLARFVPRLLGTMLDGARDLQFRRIDEHHLIPLQANIDVLAFDRMAQQRVSLVRQGEQDVETYFREHVGPVDPVRATVLLSDLAAHVRQLLNTTGVVRAWVLVPADDEYLRIAFSANMEHDADDQLLVRRSSPGVATAYERREPVLVNLKAVATAFRDNLLYKYEHALRAQSAAFACALPIFADPNDWARAPRLRAEPVAVLGVDVDEDVRLLFVSQDVEDRLATYAQIIGERLRDRAVAALSTTPSRQRVSASSALHRVAPGVEVYQRKVRSLVFDEDTARLARANLVCQPAATTS